MLVLKVFGSKEFPVFTFLWVLETFPAPSSSTRCRARFIAISVAYSSTPFAYLWLASEDCPNARELQSRFAYRIVKARWAGKSHGKQYPITLRIVGHDDIGIVTNITSIINKENDILLRSISIDSHDGLFSGMMTVMVDDTSKLESLVKKIKTVKGVKQVNRG